MARLVGTQAERIVAEAERLLTHEAAYWRGHAAQAIVRHLERALQEPSS